MGEPAIACSLSPEDYLRRMSAIRELGEVALLDVETKPDGVLLSFRNSEGVRDQLASILRAGNCVLFLPGETLGCEAGRLTLAISAPPAGMPVARDLTASFQGVANR